MHLYAFIAIFVPKLVAMVTPLCPLRTGVSQMNSRWHKTNRMSKLCMDVSLTSYNWSYGHFCDFSPILAILVHPVVCPQRTLAENWGDCAPLREGKLGPHLTQSRLGWGLPHTNLLLFLDQILRCVDEGFCVDIVFFDLAKAFDKVPHQRLLEKLRKHGIGGKLLRTTANWLSKRRQRVCVKGVKSTWE